MLKMKLMLVCLSCLVVGMSAMTIPEIEKLKRDMDRELLKLQTEKAKREALSVNEGSSDIKKRTAQALLKLRADQTNTDAMKDELAFDREEKLISAKQEDFKKRAAEALLKLSADDTSKDTIKDELAAEEKEKLLTIETANTKREDLRQQAAEALLELRADQANKDAMKDELALEEHEKLLNLQASATVAAEKKKKDSIETGDKQFPDELALEEILEDTPSTASDSIEDQEEKSRILKEVLEMEQDDKTVDETNERDAQVVRATNAVDNVGIAEVRELAETMEAAKMHPQPRTPEMDAVLSKFTKVEDLKSEPIPKKKLEALEGLLDALMKDDESQAKLVTNEITPKSGSNEKRSTNTVHKQKHDGKCVDMRKDCNRLVRYCKSHKKTMKKYCQKTCGMCPVEPEPETDRCAKDMISTNRCLKLRDEFHLCKNDRYEKRLKKLCHVTCGYCRAPSPPSCQSSKHGCCWDGVTHRDHHGKCPTCENHAHVEGICVRFASLQNTCTASGLPGKWMKEFCPASCKMCDPELEEMKSECQDDHRFPDECDKWVAQRDCEDDHVVRDELCRYSCGTCNIQQIEQTYRDLMSGKIATR